ncbi:MAG: hypothetical protein FWG79_09255, partial [Bacteroidales bacterium]|nr:hypothetical protein [Bacteroidales bacterium]
MTTETPLPVVKIGAFQKKAWKISKEQARIHSTQKIEEELSLFNRICNGNFYMVDYFHEKLIVGVSSASTLTGHSQTLVKKEGFEFYHRILKPDEFNWLVRMTKEAHNIFYKYPVSQRQDLEFSYGLTAMSANGGEMVLRHRLVPYQLCKNGNMWLSLCFVSISSSLQEPGKAAIVNSKTGEQYDFVKNKFVLSTAKALTHDDIKVLKWMTQELSTGQMCKLLKMSESCFKRHKKT